MRGLLIAVASLVAECRLSSWGTQAYLSHGMWDLPRPGLEPLSPASAGRFLATGPQRKSHRIYFLGFFNIFKYLLDLT